MPKPLVEVVILLMEEILHQLIGSLSQYLQAFIHPRWCRISSINSTPPIAIEFSRHQGTNVSLASSSFLQIEGYDFCFATAQHKEILPCTFFKVKKTHKKTNGKKYSPKFGKFHLVKDSSVYIQVLLLRKNAPLLKS